jgi:uncharacterized protein (TIGR03382 family)
VLDATDCDDRTFEINAGAQELCNDAIDNDCDTLIDEDCGSGGKSTGCNCDSPGSGAGWLVLGLAPLFLRRR